MEAEISPPAPFRAGDLVRRHANTAHFGTVVDARWNPELEDHLVRVKMGRNMRTLPAGELEPLSTDGPDLWQDFSSGRVSPVKSLRLVLAAERLRALPHPLGERFIPAKGRFLPWQYKPMLRMLDEEKPRLLVADDDGLGKTLEAGYVMHAWIARRQAQRVLVAVPEAERMRWRHALEQRLGIPLQRIDARTLRQQLQSLQRGWGLPSFFWLVSLEALARADVAATLEAVAPKLDLVIVDEAHRLARPETPLYRSATVLGRGAGALLLLSGTPVLESIQDLAPLLALLEPERFSPTTDLTTGDEGREAIAAHVSRTRAGQVSERLAQRVPLHVPVPASEAESALYALLEEVTRSLYEAAPAHRRPDALLVLQAVSSSLPAGTGLLQERLKLEGLWVGGLERANEIDEDPERTPDQDLRWDVPEALRATIVRRIDTLMYDRFEAYVDARLDMLVHVLTTLWMEDRDAGRPERKVVIFTRFRRTLRYLAHHLTTVGFETRLLSGIIPLEEQRNRVHEFLSNPNLNVLVSTELGGEGIDLQAASAVIHYDLPWDPAALERRTVRIDRLGQNADRVAVITLVTAGTLEERVLLPLYGRLGLFQDAGGGMVRALEAADVEALMLENMRHWPEEEAAPEPAEAAPPEASEATPGDAPATGTPEAVTEDGEASPETPPPPPVEQIPPPLPPLIYPKPDEIAANAAIDRLVNRVKARVAAHQTAMKALDALLPANTALDAGLVALNDLRRMPEPQEARQLVMSVLLAGYIGVWLKGDPVAAVAQLDLPPIAVREIQAWAKGKGARAERLAGRLHPQGGPIPVTLNPDVAMSHLDAELLQAGHPLVRFALEKLEPDLKLHGRAFSVAMPSTHMPAGQWAVGVWSVQPGAAQSGRRLEPVVCRLDDDNAALHTGTEAEALLGLIITHAQELEALSEASAATAEDAAPAGEASPAAVVTPAAIDPLLAASIDRLKAGFSERLEALRAELGLESATPLDPRHIAVIRIEVREVPVQVPGEGDAPPAEPAPAAPAPLSELPAEPAPAEETS